MKQMLLATLVAISFSSAFAGTVETEETRKITCKITMSVIDQYDGDDNYRHVVLDEQTTTALDVTRDGSVQISMGNGVGLRALVAIRKTEGNKLTTTASLEDLLTGVSTSAVSVTKGDAQEVESVTATIYSTNKIAIFNDSKNKQLQLECK
jgi:hypothetical protein